MDKYVFTLATQDNALVILKFYRDLIGTAGCTWNLDYPNEEIINNDINNKSLYLLKENDQIISVAFAGGSDELQNLKWLSKNPCDLARIGVLQSKQNQGIGSLMIKYIIEAVKKRGFDGIRMLVSKNNPSALALYDKNEFTRYEEVNMYNIDFYCYEMVFS